MNPKPYFHQVKNEENMLAGDEAEEEMASEEAEASTSDISKRRKLAPTAKVCSFCGMESRSAAWFG